MRTDAQILSHVEEIAEDEFGDMFGAERGELLSVLPFGAVQKFLNDGVSTEDWTPMPRDRESIVARMAEYLSFAWEKALHHRGISANRSIDHMRGWLWLLEDEELLVFAAADDNYPNYGAPILAKICEKYDIAVPDREDARRMAQGLQCDPDGCEEGCGR